MPQPRAPPENMGSFAKKKDKAFAKVTSIFKGKSVKSPACEEENAQPQDRPDIARTARLMADLGIEKHGFESSRHEREVPIKERNPDEILALSQPPRGRRGRNPHGTTQPDDENRVKLDFAMSKTFESPETGESSASGASRASSEAVRRAWGLEGNTMSSQAKRGSLQGQRLDFATKKNKDT